MRPKYARAEDSEPVAEYSSWDCQFSYMFFDFIYPLPYIWIALRPIAVSVESVADPLLPSISSACYPLTFAWPTSEFLGCSSVY